VTDNRVSRVGAEVLIVPIPGLRASRVGVEVLTTSTFFGPRWYDGTTRVSANLKGWWDGTTIRPVTTKGWWDGSGYKPVL
jgi:hypothetical protein